MSVARNLRGSPWDQPLPEPEEPPARASFCALHEPVLWHRLDHCPRCRCESMGMAWLEPKAQRAPRPSTTAKYVAAFEQARALRRKGRSYNAIGRELGHSAAFVHRLLNPGGVRE